MLWNRRHPIHLPSLHPTSFLANQSYLRPDTRLTRCPSPMTLDTFCNVSPTSINPHHNESLLSIGRKLSPLTRSSNHCIDWQPFVQTDKVDIRRSGAEGHSSLQDSCFGAQRTITKTSSITKRKRLPSFKEFVEGAKIRRNHVNAKFAGQVSGCRTEFVLGKKRPTGNAEVFTHNFDSSSLSCSPALKPFGRESLSDSRLCSPVSSYTSSVGAIVGFRPLDLEFSSNTGITDVGQVLAREKNLAQSLVGGKKTRFKCGQRNHRKPRTLNYPCTQCTHIAKQKADLKVIFPFQMISGPRMQSCDSKY